LRRNIISPIDEASPITHYQEGCHNRYTFLYFVFETGRLPQSVSEVPAHITSDSWQFLYFQHW